MQNLPLEKLATFYLPFSINRFRKKSMILLRITR